MFFGSDNSVLAETTCQNWTTVANIGGVIKYDPAVFATGGKLVVVAVGSDNVLWANEFDPSNNQNEWYLLGGVITSGPSLADVGSGKFSASAFGGDNAV